MPQILIPSQRPAKRVTSFALHSMIGIAKKLGKKMKVDTETIVCGCYDCSFRGDISEGQSVRLAKKSDSVFVLVHSGCMLERGLQVQQLDAESLITALGRVKGITVEMRVQEMPHQALATAG